LRQAPATSNPVPAVKHPAVLVLSHDPLGSALLAAAAELAGMHAVFRRSGEAVRDALRRYRPHLVLVDCARDDVSTEAFVGPALMTGARVAVYCAAGHEPGAARGRELAARHQLMFFELPGDADALQGYLAALARERSGSRRSAGG
jgi:DNA-binding NtrC family response regulator